MLINTFVSYFVSLFRATLRSRDICFVVHKKKRSRKSFFSIRAHASGCEYFFIKYP